MDDEALFTNVRAVLVAGIGNVAVRQDFQPTTQGPIVGKSLYMHKAAERRYGWRRSADDANGVHVETQLIESTIQITAYDPDEDGYPMMIAQDAADLLQSDAGQAALRALGLSPFRVTDVRPPFLVNAEQRFESSPNFDIVLQHERTRAYEVADATVLGGIYRV